MALASLSRCPWNNLPLGSAALRKERQKAVPVGETGLKSEPHDRHADKHCFNCGKPLTRVRFSFGFSQSGAPLKRRHSGECDNVC